MKQKMVVTEREVKSRKVPSGETVIINGTARASFSLYNTLEEVSAFFAGLRKAQTMLG